MEINTHVSGIPCIARVVSRDSQAALGPGASNDIDCYGYDEIEFEICDRRGRPADWLAKKLDRHQENRITEELANAFAESLEDY